MGLLDENTKAEIKELFKGIEQPVKLVYFYKDNDCPYCSQIGELVDELASLSPKLNAEKHNLNEKEIAKRYGIDRAPVIIVEGKNKGKIRFFGIPSGHEFGPFLMTIIDASRGDTDELPKELKDMIKMIDFPVRLLVFITPQCPYCPLSVRLAHLMALFNENVIADAVEAVEYGAWATKYAVRGVPKTVVNDKLEFEGAHPPDIVITKILRELR